MVDDGNLLHAPDGAVGRAGFSCEIFSLNVGECVLLERDPGIATLLGTVMHQAVFTNVEIASAGAASPIVWFAASEIFLEPIEPAVTMLAIRLDLPVHAFLASIQRLHRAVAVVNDAERAGETELNCAFCNDLGVFGIANTAADYGIDIHCEVGQLGKILKFLIQDLQALFGYVVRFNIVDADLKVFEPGLVQGHDFLRR